jgi:hypothetical protein
VEYNSTEKKGDSQCRSCKKVFNHSDLILKQTERFGITINEKVCPHCFKNTYGLIEYPVKEEELIYKGNYIFDKKTEKEQKRLLMSRYMLDDEQELDFYLNGYQIIDRKEIYNTR